MKILLCILFFSMFVFSLFAETPAETPVETAPQTSQQPLPFPGENIPAGEGQPETSFTMQFMHMLTTLGLLIAMVLLGTWVLKRMMHTRVQQVNLTSSIKILEQRALTTKTVVSLIEIRGKEFAIAESGTAVTLLGAFGHEEDNKGIK